MCLIVDDPDDRTFMTFDEWAAHIRKRYDGAEVGDRSWIAVGEWLLNAKENRSYNYVSVGYHICIGNYERIYFKELGFNKVATQGAVSGIEEGCAMCGQPMPEGIRMVALLEKL